MFSCGKLSKCKRKAKKMNTVKLSEYRKTGMARRSIVMTSSDGLADFRRMIDRYSAEAHALNRKKQELSQLLRSERDVEKIKDLELRKSTVEAERYEVLADMRELIAYVSEREKCAKAGR